MFWKIVIGTGVGVGAVAAAPFTGGGSIFAAIAAAESLAIAGTAGAIATATVTAVTTGGAAVLAVNKIENEMKNKINNAKENGKQEAKAEYAIQISKLTEHLKKLNERMASTDRYFETLIAMENIAVAVIAFNTINVRTKQNEISEILRSLSDDTLPQNIKDKIHNIYLKPPTIQEALLLAKNSNLDKETCRDTIILSSEICNIENNKFLIEWEKKYNRSKV